VGDKKPGKEQPPVWFKFNEVSPLIQNISTPNAMSVLIVIFLFSNDASAS